MGALVLTRESLRDNWVERMVTAAALGVKVLSEEERCCSRDAILASHPPGSDLWLFGYGSLIWNPAFEFEERRQGRIHGHHRAFCLWTHLGRGSPDRPGLVLGLERGGSCGGMAFRIRADRIEEELDLVWRREMVTGAYCPSWVKVATAAGPVRAVTFVINRAHDRYEGAIDPARVVEAIALAEGSLGPCRDYLFNTAAHLAELGIADRGLARLVAEVCRYRAGLALDVPAAGTEMAPERAPATA